MGKSGTGKENAGRKKEVNRKKMLLGKRGEKKGNGKETSYMSDIMLIDDIFMFTNLYNKNGCSAHPPGCAVCAAHPLGGNVPIII